MSKLIEIQSQIEALQKQATVIKAKEFDATVQDIVAKMTAFGITAKDLQAAAGKPRGKKVKGPVAKAPKPKKDAPTIKVAAKYKGPNGETWSGRGLSPKWLATLVAAGRSREEFAIQSAA